jgi:DNA polymerase-3 subunit epsilon
MTYTRPYKGKSLIDFPSSYVMIDIETTGLSPMWDEIIEISALRINT